MTRSDDKIYNERKLRQKIKFQNAWQRSEKSIKRRLKLNKQNLLLKYMLTWLNI